VLIICTVFREYQQVIALLYNAAGVPAQHYEAFALMSMRSDIRFEFFTAVKI
jgi:hypothetical protein